MTSARWRGAVVVLACACACACGGQVVAGDGGTDGGGAGDGGGGPFACGNGTCSGANAVCIHPCCGGIMLCEALEDGGLCPIGTSISQTCPIDQPCSNGPCTPPPPYCGTTADCSMVQGHDCYLVCQ